MKNRNEQQPRPCIDFCPRLGPVAGKVSSPDNLSATKFTTTGIDKEPVDYPNRFGLMAPLTGKYSRAVGSTYGEAERFKAGMEFCPRPKRKRLKVGPIEIPLWTKCQNPALKRGK